MTFLFLKIQPYTKVKRTLSFLSLIGLCVLFSYTTQAQIQPTTGQTALQLAQNIAGVGVTVSNASITGDPNAIGEFTTGPNATGLGINSGVVMASGDIVDIPAGNGTFASSVLGSGSEPYLAALAGTASNDAIILQFDFVPNADFVSFNYVFGSEEYPEWVCSSFNDMFAFTIEGVTVPSPQTNIALIPGTNIPVGINTINDDPSCMTQAANGGQNNIAYYINNQVGPASQWCVYDGLTVVMIAETAVICGETYRLRLMLSDGGDSSYDSGCFIEENSLTTGNVTISTTSLGGDLIATEGCDDIEVTLTLNGGPTPVDLPVPIWIDDFTAIWGTDYDPIPQLNTADSTIVIPAGTNQVSFTITPVNDNISEGPEYIDFVAITSTCGLLDTLTLWIVDMVPLSLDMPNDTVICMGNAILTAQGLGGGGEYTYDWTGFGIVDTIFPAPTVTTMYYCTVTDECGSAPATDSVEVVVDGGPPANAGFDVFVCIGGTVPLNGATVANCTYEWAPALYLDDPFVNNPNCTPLADQEYEFIVTRDDGCENRDTMQVVLTPEPTADFTMPAQACLGAPIIIDYTGNADAAGSYNYDFGNGTVLNGSGQGPYSVQWDVPGIQNVSLDVFWHGCLSPPVTNQIEIIDLPVVDAGLPQTDCSGEVVQIGQVGVPGFAYSWTPVVNLDDPTAANPSVTLANASHSIASTMYYVTVNNQGCVGADSVMVSALPIPTVEFAVPEGICMDDQLGGGFDFEATGFFGPTAGVTWDFGPNGFPQNSTDLQPQDIIFNNTGAQDVTVSIVDNGCVGLDYTAQVQVHEMPIASFISNDLEGCQPYESKFINTSVHNSSFIYETWDFGDDQSSTQNDPVHVFSDPGQFDINLIVTTAEGCKDSASSASYILVHPKPNALFRVTPHQVDIINSEVQFTNVTTGLETSEYVVSPPGASMFGFDVNYVFDDTITYDITQYVATEFGCMDTISTTLKVEPVYNFYIPSGFTPNDDGINELWGPNGEGIKSYECWILNRWNEPLFFTGNLDEKWDGRYKGKMVPQGVYTYRIETWDVLGEPHEYFGGFTLSR